MSDEGSGREAASFVGVAERELLALLLQQLKKTVFNTTNYKLQ
jgi:hypothetical protein